jgi:8-oxo-dGTP diphosphatase
MSCFRIHKSAFPKTKPKGEVQLSENQIDSNSLKKLQDSGENLKAEWEKSAYTVLIVFCFLVQDGKILLITRANEPYKGSCTIPGGRKRRGESLREACVRKMKEETGLSVKNLKFAGLLHVYTKDDNIEYVSAYFTTDDFSGEIAHGEDGELSWVDFDKSLSMTNVHPSYKALFPSIRDSKTPFSVVLRLDADGRGEYAFE